MQAKGKEGMTWTFENLDQFLDQSEGLHPRHGDDLRRASRTRRIGPTSSPISARCRTIRCRCRRRLRRRPPRLPRNRLAQPRRRRPPLRRRLQRPRHLRPSRACAGPRKDRRTFGDGACAGRRCGRLAGHAGSGRRPGGNAGRIRRSVVRRRRRRCPVGSQAAPPAEATSPDGAPDRTLRPRKPRRNKGISALRSRFERPAHWRGVFALRRMKFR